MLTRCLGTKDNATTTGLGISVPGTSEEFSIRKWGWGDRRGGNADWHKLARRIIARRRLIFWLEIANMDVACGI